MLNTNEKLCALTRCIVYFFLNARSLHSDSLAAGHLGVSDGQIAFAFAFSDLFALPIGYTNGLPMTFPYPHTLDYTTPSHVTQSINTHG